MKPSNILRIDSLDIEWSDKDIIMLHACFQILVDCIEKENLLNGHVDWKRTDETKLVAKELSDLYEWWTVRRFNEQSGNTDPIWTKGLYEEDTDMLIRLIKVRKYLWT